MRQFSRKVHDAIVLDDCRDFAFLIQHQDKLQGKVDAKVEFASTPGGQCAYSKYLFKVPFAVTCNYDAKNLELLETSDWLGNGGNRVLVTFPLGQASEGSESRQSRPPSDAGAL